MPSPPIRVASLLPSATEMVCALGMRDALVGISHECDHPADVAGVPVLTSSKIAPLATSGAVDEDVRRVLRDALAVYDIDVEALRRAAPDVIVTQDLCDVCAVSLADVERAARALTNPDVDIVNLRPLRLADIWEDIRRVGRALGREPEARALLASLDERVAAVRTRADATGTEKPLVLTIEWLDPVMVGGTWMPELVELAGGHPLVTRAGERAPTLSTNDLRGLDPAPDVVVVKPCGFEIERTLAEAASLATLLSDLPWPAVREQRLWIADGNAYFNRPGPRIVDSLEILAACLRPTAFEDLAERHAGCYRRFELPGRP